MNSYTLENECMPESKCRPRCMRRCVGTFTKKYKVYENCCYSIYQVCPCCGHEYNPYRYHRCPSCGTEMADPPGDPPAFGRFGGFGSFGGFGRFGRFGRFGDFDDFGGFRRFPRFGFFPFFPFFPFGGFRRF